MLSNNTVSSLHFHLYSIVILVLTIPFFLNENIIRIRENQTLMKHYDFHLFRMGKIVIMNGVIGNRKLQGNEKEKLFPKKPEAFIHNFHSNKIVYLSLNPTVCNTHCS